MARVQSKFEANKDPKMVLDTTLFNNQHYEVRVKGKVEQSMDSCALSQCSRYWKGSLRDALDYCRQLYLLMYYIKFVITSEGVLFLLLLSCFGHTTKLMFPRCFWEFGYRNLSTIATVMSPCVTVLMSMFLFMKLVVLRM